MVLADQAAPNEEELRRWVSEQLLSTRAPALVEFRGELPYNDLGKLLRRVLREELTACRS